MKRTIFGVALLLVILSAPTRAFYLSTDAWCEAGGWWGAWVWYIHMCNGDN